MSSTPPPLTQSRTAQLSTIELSLDIPITPRTPLRRIKKTKYSPESPIEYKSTLRQLSKLKNIDEQSLLHNNGYKLLNKICNTLQGGLYKAVQYSTNTFVAIKKTDKYLYKESIAIEDGANFCVSENIVKESQILKYVTLNNQPIGGYITQYIDFIESPRYYYLITEYIASETNLKQFISRAKQYINDGVLSIKHYHKMMKYILWQLSVTVQWLHLSMKCCHLDICLENIMVNNASFIPNKHGMTIHHGISIKLCDFGVAEVFEFKNRFLCTKQPLSLVNTAYSAPKVYVEEVYDARCADNWSLGMILFECMSVGEHIYTPLDIHRRNSGYWALKHHRLLHYLSMNKQLRYFNIHSFAVLNRLLTFNEEKRLKGMNILKHEWFDMYYKRYKQQIKKKFSRVGHGFITYDTSSI